MIKLIQFAYEFQVFIEFCVFCKVTMGSARSQKKFLDKQSETCQKSSSSKKSTDLRMKVDFSKSIKLSSKQHIYTHLCIISKHFSDFRVFGIITLGSARSQKNFLDKQSETCQKGSSCRKSTDLRMKVDFSKSIKLSSKQHIYTHLCMISSHFSIFVFFVLSHWALRDLRKICLTNNLRFVRRVPAPGNLQIRGGKWISQNQSICSEIV